MTDELTCQELTSLITAYLDGSLSADTRERFEDHLARCIGCQHYLAQIRHTIALTGSLRVAALSKAERAEMLAVFQGFIGESTGPRAHDVRG